MRRSLSHGVTRVEFGNRSVEVVAFEYDDSQHPFVGIDLDYVEQFVLERVVIAAGKASLGQRKQVSSGGEDRPRSFHKTDTGSRLQILDRGFATTADPTVYSPPTIVDGEVLGYLL